MEPSENISKKGIPRSRDDLVEYFEDIFCIFSDFFFIGFSTILGGGIAYLITLTIWQNFQN